LVRFQTFGQFAEERALVERTLKQLRDANDDEHRAPSSLTVGRVWRCLEQWSARVCALPVAAANGKQPIFDDSALGEQLFNSLRQSKQAAD
jgi:hypothetical protein